MSMLMYVRAWLAERFNLDEMGQAAVDFTLVLLGLVLFLIAATFLLRGTITTAVAAIDTWIAGVGPPPAP